MRQEESEMTSLVTKREKKDVARSRDRFAPFEDMDRMFDALVSRGWMQPFGWSRPRHGEMSAYDYAFPRFDVIDRDKEILVKAGLPGVKKDDLEVTVIDNILTIKGKTFTEEKEEEGEFYRSEITRGEFSRSVTLPSDVDVDKATTILKGGMLTLKLPKLAVSKRRHIAIS